MVQTMDLVDTVDTVDTVDNIEGFEHSSTVSTTSAVSTVPSKKTGSTKGHVHFDRAPVRLADHRRLPHSSDDSVNALLRLSWRWLRRSHQLHLLTPGGELRFLFGGQNAEHLRHHFGVRNVELDLNFRASFSGRTSRSFIELSA